MLFIADIFFDSKTFLRKCYSIFYMDDLNIFHGLYELFETVNLSLDCSSSYKHKSFLFKMMTAIPFNTIILDALEYSCF